MRARDATLADTALTTQRPFYHPVPLKQLAGMGFHPERRSALHDRHAALDAKFMTVGGWQRPEYYRLAGLARTECIVAGSARGARRRGTHRCLHARQDRDLRSGCRRVSRSRVYAGSFSDLRVGMTRYGLLLDEGGIVRDDGVIARLGEQRYYFTTTTGGAANVYRELLLWNARWRMDCAFVNATGHRAAFNLAGPASRELLQSLTDIDLSEDGVSVPRRARRPASRACDARVLRAGFVSSLGFEIHVPYRVGGPAVGRLDARAPAFAPSASRPSACCGSRRATPSSRRTPTTSPIRSKRVSAGRCAWASRSSWDSAACASTCAAARGRSWSASSWRRTQTRAPLIGEANLLIHNGNIAGRVTSIAHSPTLGRTIGLGHGVAALSEPGSNLVIRASDGRQVGARVVRTPFVGAV